MIEAGVSLYPGGNRQGFGSPGSTPEQDGVELSFVQIVESCVRRERGRQLNIGILQDIGERQEPRVRFPNHEDAPHDLGRCRRQVDPLILESLASQLEFFARDRGPNQMLQSKGGLGRMDRRSHVQVGVVIMPTKKDDGDATRACGGLEPHGKPGRIAGTGIDDDAFDSHVRDGTLGGLNGARRHRLPAEAIKAIRQTAGQVILCRKNENSCARGWALKDVGVRHGVRRFAHVTVLTQSRTEMVSSQWG